MSEHHHSAKIPASKTISSVSGREVQQLICKILQVQNYLPSIQSIPILDYGNSKNDSTVPCCRSSRANATKKNMTTHSTCNTTTTTISTATEKPPKHLGQIESIVGHMQQNGLLPLSPHGCCCCGRRIGENDHRHNDSDGGTASTIANVVDNINDTANSKTKKNHIFNHYFIEFGCGTAKLSDHVNTTILQRQQQQQEELEIQNRCTTTTTTTQQQQPSPPPSTESSQQQQQCHHHNRRCRCQYNYILIDQQPMKAVERYCDGRIRSSRHQRRRQRRRDKSGRHGVNSGGGGRGHRANNDDDDDERHVVVAADVDDDDIDIENDDDLVVVQRFTCPISTVRLYDIVRNWNNNNNAATVTIPNATNGSRTNDCRDSNNNNIKETIGTVTAMCAMAKHLCGSATDDAIQCIRDYYQDCCCRRCNETNNNNTNDDDNRPVSTTMMIPLVIATCCHYACEAQTLINYKLPSCCTAVTTATTDILPTTISDQNNNDNNVVTVDDPPLSYLQYLGFTIRDIDVLLIVSQWASIKVVRTDNDDDNDSLFHDNDTNYDRTVHNQPPSQRRLPFPPPLPPHPMPVAIDVDINTTIDTSMGNGKMWLMMSSDAFEETFTRRGKQELGRYSKILIDTARAYYLKYSCHYNNVQLLYYTTASVERQLLIATN